MRKHKTSGRKGKNVGKAFVDLKDKEQQDKVLGLSLVYLEQPLVFAQANA